MNETFNRILSVKRKSELGEIVEGFAKLNGRTLDKTVNNQKLKTSITIVTQIIL